MARLCFDYGHGGFDPGACFNGRRECDDVLNLGKQVAEEIREYGVIVDETRTSDITVSLSERSSFEHRNTYDYFISFHRNAFVPEQAKGAETYTYVNASERTKELAQRIQTSLVALGFINRGVKEANYHVLRETIASAVLIEIGFVDNTSDNNLFDSKRNEIIKVLVKVILAQLGINYAESAMPIETTNGEALYRVMAGSYSVRENAEKQVQELKEAGFDAAIMIKKDS